MIIGSLIQGFAQNGELVLADGVTWFGVVWFG